MKINQQMKVQFRELIAKDTSLSSTERLVGDRLAWAVNCQRGFAFPSQATLADSIGISRRTLQRAIKALKERGYLLIERLWRGPARSFNRYRMNWSLLMRHRKRKARNMKAKQPKSTASCASPDRQKQHVKTAKKNLPSDAPSVTHIYPEEYYSPLQENNTLRKPTQRNDTKNASLIIKQGLARARIEHTMQPGLLKDAPPQRRRMRDSELIVKYERVLEAHGYARQDAIELIGALPAGSRYAVLMRAEVLPPDKAAEMLLDLVGNRSKHVDTAHG